LSPLFVGRENFLFGGQTINNFYPEIYYKLHKDGKVGYYSPYSITLANVKIKYKKLDNLKERFMRFEDEEGKIGWLSEDGEEFYDM
jgi:hypothetical protein